MSHLLALGFFFGLLKLMPLLLGLVGVQHTPHNMQGIEGKKWYKIYCQGKPASLLSIYYVTHSASHTTHNISNIFFYHNLSKYYSQFAGDKTEG